MCEVEDRLHTEALRLQKASQHVPALDPILDHLHACVNAGLRLHHTLYLLYELVFDCAQATAMFPLAARAVAMQVRAENEFEICCHIAEQVVTLAAAWCTCN